MDVEFYVFARAGSFPGVFTVFHVFRLRLQSAFFAFKQHAQTTIGGRGEGSESEKFIRNFSVTFLEVKPIDTIFIILLASLIIQLFVLALLFYGYWLYRHKAFRKHGMVMASALFVHLASVIVVMLPSFAFAILPGYIAVNPADLTSILSIVHGVLGVVAIGLGLWFVASWRFRKDIKGCFGKRNPMLITLSAWVITLLIGIVVFGNLYWSLLMG